MILKEVKNDGSTSAIGFHIQETSSLIIPKPLNGTNYVEWSLNAQNKIRGRKHWGFVSCKKDKHSEVY